MSDGDSNDTSPEYNSKELSLGPEAPMKKERKEGRKKGGRRKERNKNKKE
jgi:hypothetical protein